MKRFLVTVVCLLLFIGIAFGAMLLLGNIGKSTVITDTTCDPPCWHGIQPGQTTPWEAVSILEEMGVGGMQQWGESDEKSEIAWMFHYPVGDSAGYIYSLDGRVAAISIHTSGSLTLAEALEKLGEPDSMWMHYEKIEWRHWLEIILVYPTRGFFVEIDIELPSTEESALVEIKGNSPVDKVIYFDPAWYEYFLSSRTFFREDEQTILERLQPWPGLGEISYEHLLRD